MSDNSDGTNSADYTIYRDGDVTTCVVLARQGGLNAQYFNNAFLSGSPTLTKVDHQLHFEWDLGMLTPEAGDFVSAHWYGKLLAPKSEPYTFVLMGDEGFRLYLDGHLLIDRWDSCCDVMQATTQLDQDSFYDIVLEYKEMTGNANFSVEWYSTSTVREIIPPTQLFYS
jgi:beta-glucosidase